MSRKLPFAAFVAVSLAFCLEAGHAVVPVSALQAIAATIGVKGASVVPFLVEDTESAIPSGKAIKVFGNFKATSVRPILKPEQEKQLLALVAKAQSKPGKRSRCIFSPGVALEIVGKHEDPPAILICFKCNEWEFRRGDQSEIIGFDNQKAEMRKFVRTIFPELKFND